MLRSPHHSLVSHTPRNYDTVSCREGPGSYIYDVGWRYCLPSSKNCLNIKVGSASHIDIWFVCWLLLKIKTLPVYSDGQKNIFCARLFLYEEAKNGSWAPWVSLYKTEERGASGGKTCSFTALYFTAYITIIDCIIIIIITNQLVHSWYGGSNLNY